MMKIISQSYTIQGFSIKFIHFEISKWKAYDFKCPFHNNIVIINKVLG